MNDTNRTQTDPTRHPNQQDPATLLAPESAPEHHKTYHDRDTPDPDATPVQGLTGQDDRTGSDGSGSERWGASDWTRAGQAFDGFPVEKGSDADVTK